MIISTHACILPSERNNAKWIHHFVRSSYEIAWQNNAKRSFSRVIIDKQRCVLSYHDRIVIAKGHSTTYCFLGLFPTFLQEMQCDGNESGFQESQLYLISFPALPIVRLSHTQGLRNVQGLLRKAVLFARHKAKVFLFNDIRGGARIGSGGYNCTLNLSLIGSQYLDWRQTTKRLTSKYFA